MQYVPAFAAGSDPKSAEQWEGVRCNICGGAQFVPYKTRGPIRCQQCGSIERNRILVLYLEKFVRLRPGLRVLHLAPERTLFNHIARIVGSGYDPRDIDLKRYASLRHNGVQVRRLDLCTEVEGLPSNLYDLILHNHVMEHLPCNVTAVLFHLHRSLKPDGLHMFSIPILNVSSEESFAEMSREERQARFTHPEHYRNFGKKDLPSTLGMVFDIEKQMKRTLADLFGEELLRQINVPQSRWHKFSGANMFLLRKGDIKLTERGTKTTT